MDSFYSWNPEQSREKKTEVIFLNGFLGTGKTTLLNFLLRNSGERKIAVLVNDVGEINIDADLVKTVVGSESTTSTPPIVELTNGCICCSSNSALPESLFNLIRDYAPDTILVESSGVAEPNNLVSSLRVPNSYGRSIFELISIANLVTLVDPKMFLDKWQESSKKTHRTHLLLGDPRQPLIELMVNQVECADLIILTKSDMVSSAEQDEASELIRSLNNRAEIMSISNGEMDTSLLFETARFVPSDTMNAKVDHEHHHHTNYGLESFLFTARRPFRRDSFLKLIRQDFPGVIRAKGTYWIEEDDQYRGFLSLAGGVVRADRSGRWFMFHVEHGYKELDEMPESVQKVWDETTGDRRQEIVFIGIDMDVDAMKRKLELCLV